MMTYCIRGILTRTAPWTDKTGKPGHLLTITDENQTITVATTNPAPQTGEHVEAIGGIRETIQNGYTKIVLTRATVTPDQGRTRAAM